MISSSEKMKSSLSSLKGRSISRIKLDMIQNVLSKTDGKFLIMVIDDSAAKILLLSFNERSTQSWNFLR